MVVEETDIVFAMLKSIVDAIFYELFREVHVVGNLIESHLRLHHPELRKMSGCV